MNEEKIDFSLFLNEYLSDARQGFQRANTALLALEKDYTQIERLDEVSRAIHTLKSSSAMLGFTEISDFAHFSEDLLAKVKTNEIPVARDVIDLIFEIIDTLEGMVKERGEGKTSAESEVRSEELKARIHNAEFRIQNTEVRIQKPEGKSPIPKFEIEKIETIRVNVKLLDLLFNQVGELIITKNRIKNILADAQNKELKDILSTLEHIVIAMQENVSTARLVPAGEIFQKFPRMVRDIARDEHKEIELSIEGQDIELDKGVLDAISEPVIHLLRNAVGHGIELPEQRQKQNKDRRGIVRLIAKRAENHILIDVTDDGKGIDTSHIKNIAVEKGFIKPEEAETLKDRDIINLLFIPGFSTIKEVTGLSGRGVGLDVVKRCARELGGTIEVETKVGKGARFSLTLPLTTAVIQTLLIEVRENTYAIPSDIVRETMRIDVSEIKEIEDRKVFVRGKEIIPFVPMHEVLGIISEHGREFNVVIVQKGQRVIGLAVDTVLGQMENIIKPFDPIAQGFKGFTGGAILGDGRVALLLDIPTLFNFATLEEERFTI